jgi:hypothetical protein
MALGAPVIAERKVDFAEVELRGGLRGSKRKQRRPHEGRCGPPRLQ